MNAIIISIGDELILGQTVDTNSAWLSRQLAAAGFKPAQHLTVSDDQEAIEGALLQAAQLADVVLVTGGLGPTQDDLTRQALAAVLDQPLELNAAALADVEGFFKALKREMPPGNRVQAMLPRGASMIRNGNGTAPGLRATLKLSAGEEEEGDGGSFESRCEIWAMPGVPKEMTAMFEESILPELKKRAGGRVVLSRTLHTFGMGESAVGQKLGELMKRERNPSVGTTVSNGYVSLRLNAYFNSRAKAEAELAQTEAACRTALGELIWGADEQTLPEVVGRMLREAGKTVATAESCTGGLVAKYLTDVPGSSDYFERGWVTYSNESKVNSLGISQELLAEQGAVSEGVAEAMAIEAYLHSGAECAIGISGIAGPGGGSPDKPVGTVCISVYLEGGEPLSVTRTFLFSGDREMIRDRAAKMGLMMLRHHLMGTPPPF